MDLDQIHTAAICCCCCYDVASLKGDGEEEKSSADSAVLTVHEQIVQDFECISRYYTYLYKINVNEA